MLDKVWFFYMKISFVGSALKFQVYHGDHKISFKFCLGLPALYTKKGETLIES